LGIGINVALVGQVLIWRSMSAGRVARSFTYRFGVKGILERHVKSVMTMKCNASSYELISVELSRCLAIDAVP